MMQKNDLGPTDEGDKDVFQLAKITSMKVTTSKYYKLITNIIANGLSDS